MEWQYALFLAITSFRQFLQVAVIFRNWIRKVTSTKKDITGFVGWFSACLINGIYSGVWLYSIYLGYYQENCGTYLKCTGLCLLVFGAALRVSTLMQFWKQYSDKSIVAHENGLEIKGIFRIVRHPMNLSVLLETAGMIIFVRTWWLFAAWAIICVTVIARNKREDTILRAIYGEDALKYQAKVPSMNIFRGVFSVLYELVNNN